MQLYPQAGEATCVTRNAQLALEDLRVSQLGKRTAEQIEADSARRAKKRVRRWIRANRCNHMWTLTFREAVYDYAQLPRLIERFKERFLSIWGTTPALLIPEPHPGGHGWHFHMATDRYLPKAKVQAVWGQGLVHVSGPRKGRVKGGPRKVASYLAKYVTKTFTEVELGGCIQRHPDAHRYWKTGGYEPICVRREFRTLRELAAWLRRRYGQWDEQHTFGMNDDMPVIGIWFGFPDGCLHPPPERVQADSRAERGQP